MKRLIALFAAVAFVAGTVGLAAAQAPAKPEEKKPADKKMDGAKAEKKPAAKNASGTVKNATADSLVVAGKEKGKDAEWTFALDAKTKVKKGGKDVMAKDIAPGDAVQVRYTDEGGKAVAQNVTVKAAGTDKKAADGAKKDDAMAKKPAEKK